MDDQARALSGQILVCFGKEFRVEWELIAKTGATTADTVTHMESLPSAVFDVAVTSLGVNDVKTGVTKDQWLDRQKKLVCLLREKFKVKKLLISAVPPMEMFPALPWPLGFYLGLCSSQMNRSMGDWLKTQTDCEFLKFNLPFDKNLMAEDGFHPGPKLHTLCGKYLNGSTSTLDHECSIPGNLLKLPSQQHRERGQKYQCKRKHPFPKSKDSIRQDLFFTPVPPGDMAVTRDIAGTQGLIPPITVIFSLIKNILANPFLINYISTKS